MFLNISQCTGQPFTIKNYVAKISVMARLRNSDLILYHSLLRLWFSLDFKPFAQAKGVVTDYSPFSIQPGMYMAPFFWDDTF